MPLDKRLEELRSYYRDVSTKTLSDGQVLVRINRTLLPRGCSPSETDFLLVFSANQDVPNGRYVKHQIRLPSGNTPGFNATIVDGEAWYGFSYNFQWNPNADPMYQYVEAALHRFAKPA